MKNLFCICLILLAEVLAAQSNEDTSICYLRDTGGRIREHNVDFITSKLNIRFDTKNKRVFGNVKYDFMPIQYKVDTLFLDGPGIVIKNVLLNGVPCKFNTDSTGLVVRFANPLDWNKQYKLEIDYEATPHKGLYFIGWDVTDTSKTKNTNRYYTRKQIWTQGQGIDNRHWIPCYDGVNDKLITQTTITFDSSYRVISNGTLKTKKYNADGTATWYYAMNKPMVPYLMMIAIDKYAYKDYKSKNGMVSRQYYYADQPEREAPTYEHSAEMMDWLSDEFGVAYPWTVYSNTPVQDFMYGAMENTTATIYGDFSLCDARAHIDRSYTATNAHELTHQWFGDCITEYSATHHWLHESFATYYAKQFIHHVFGEDRYEWDKRTEQNNAITADKGDRFPVAHSRGGSARHYPKGSAVIDMLRYVVGDSVYKKSVTAYLKKHAYENVLSDDFKMTFMETAGVNLDWFFNEWIYRAEFPVFDVRCEIQEQQAVFYICQTQQTDELTGWFTMPVVFELHFKDGSVVSQTNWLSHATDTVVVSFASGKEIDYTLFDPASNVLKEINFHKSLDEWVVQASKAKHMIDRYDALVALRDTSLEQKRNVLVGLFNANGFHGLQDEIISQLSKESSAAFFEIVKRALKSKDAAIRKSAIENMNEVPDSILPLAEKMLSDSSYVNIEITLKKLCSLFPENRQQYLALTKDIMGMHNNVRILWLELQCKEAGRQQLDQTAYVAELIEFASNRYEFRTRVRAFEALERIGFCNETLVSHLLNAAVYTNSRLANPAAKCIKSFLNKEAYAQMIRGIYSLNAYNKHDGDIIDKILTR